MNKEYRIGFKICLVVMALESVFWLIWMIFRPLSVLPWPVHISIWLSDMVLLPVLFVPVIWTWYSTINDNKHPMNGIAAGSMVFICVLPSIVTGFGLGGAMVFYLIIMLAVLIVLSLVMIIRMPLKFSPVKRLYDWILR